MFGLFDTNIFGIDMGTIKQQFKLPVRLRHNYGFTTNWKLFSLIICLVSIRFAKAGTFSDELTRVLRSTSQHGQKVAHWNADLKTRSRIRRALESTTTPGANDHVFDEYLSNKTTMHNECDGYEEYQYHDLFEKAYLGPVCDIIDARSDASKLRDLENCTIVNGFVQLVFMHDLTEEELKLYRFPKLRVITHYLVVFRMYNLKTLRYMFPNLAVIGGLELFRDYSLVLFENPHMTEIGLGNLQFINKGGVRIQKNGNLCYRDTIDWKRLGKYTSNPEIAEGKVVMRNNRDSEQCVDQCGDDSGCEKVNGQGLCWGLNLCQKRPSDSIPCDSGMCKCHDQCLAGCTRPNDPDACVACRKKYHNGTCVKKCPVGTYVIHGWLCITGQECSKLKWHVFDDVCRRQCPIGYQVDVVDCIRFCKKCESECGTVCDGDYVITDAYSLGYVEICRVIKGSLTISINGGSDVFERLDDTFHDLEEIGSLVVRRSFPLISLSFLKNLRRIAGRRMEHEIYSVYVLENQNLKELWNFTTHNLTIGAGKAFFHFNPHLCMGEVSKVRELTPVREDTEDISEITNGDKATCNLTKIEVLPVQMFSEDPYTSSYVNIVWKNIYVKDERSLIGYRIYYKESPLQDAKKNDAVDACGVNSWTIVDKQKSKYVSKSSPINSSESGDATGTSASSNTSAIDELTKPKELGNSSKLLSNLKAYTQYAFYIYAITTSTAKNGADSDIMYFTTKPARPDHPRKLRAASTTETSIDLVWDPPALPNGNITHYIVEWRRQREDFSDARTINLCTNSRKPLVVNKPVTAKPVNPEMPVDGGSNTNTGNCDCSQCEDAHISKEVERETMESSEFENYLQDNLFFPLDYEVEEYGEYSDQYTTNSSAQRYKRSLRRWRRDVSNTSSSTKKTLTNSTTASVTTSAPSTENMTTSAPEDLEYIWKREVVNGTHITIPDLHHFSHYDIHVYACNHASDPRSYTDRDFLAHKNHYNTEHHYTKCSFEAITMKRTSANRTADMITSEIEVSTQSYQYKGRTEESTRLIWKMPLDPNAYIKTFTIQVNSTETGGNEITNEICVHVNTSVTDTISYDLSTKNGLAPGSYRARIRPNSLAGEGTWSEPLPLEISDNNRQGNSTTVIIVCVLVVFAFAVACVIGLLYIRNKKNKFNNADVYMDTNPEYARFVYTPDEYEIDIEMVTILEEIGHGNFGKVFSGLAKSVVKGQEETKVAIKKLHENAPPSRRFEFLKEASTMKAFNAHHVVRLLGVVSKAADPLVIMEYMEMGDLKSYLRSRREASEENSQHLPAPTLQEKLQMAAEVADGMAYLAANKFVHRDLAARNCLVNEHGTVKIGDFGLTRDIYETDYYRKESRGFLPIRWMAPESLKDGIFDSRSDVWSYGVVLWELATLAEQPYQGQQHDEVTRFVIDGGYMMKPKNCPKRLYDLMTTCWLYNPKMRPLFIEIVQELYVDVNDEFKEVCFFGKHQEVGSGEEDEGNYLLPNEHSDMTDPAYPRVDGQFITPQSHPFHGNSFNSGEPSYYYSKNNVRPVHQIPAPHRAENEEKQGLLMPDHHYPNNTNDYRHSEDNRSPNTTSTTAMSTTPPSNEKLSNRKRNSSESLYENDYDEKLSQIRDNNLKDSESGIKISDPLISYKHLNGGHNKSKNLELDLESGVDAGSHGEGSCNTSRSNISTPDDTHVIMGNDMTMYPLLPTSNNC